MAGIDPFLKGYGRLTLDSITPLLTYYVSPMTRGSLI